MAKEIAQTSIGELVSHNQRLAGNYFSPSLMVILDYPKISDEGLELDQPYSMRELRILRCTAGYVRGSINLMDKEIHAGMIAAVPEDTIIEIYEQSPDFCVQALGSAEVGDLAPDMKPVLIEIPETSVKQMDGFFELARMLIAQEFVSERSVTLLIASMAEELRQLDQETEAGPKNIRNTSRQHVIFNEFMELLQLHGETEHHVGDYADRLCITPNHLSAIVKGESGRTVMWWIDRAAIQHAKLLLRHTNLSMTEIADRLNLPGDSFFCRLFKRYTGITPLRYRKL